MMGALALDVITYFGMCNNFPIFALLNSRDMETRLIRIGNSRGIVIPATLLKSLGVGEEAIVHMEEKDGTLALRFENEEPYTGPFTGPFKELADLVDPDAFGGRDLDPAEYVRRLRDETGVERRVIPEF